MTSESNPSSRQSISPQEAFSRLSEEEKAVREAENTLRQYDRALEYIDQFTTPGYVFRLRASALLDLQRIAVEDIEASAGTYRSGPIDITGTTHKPPPPHLVPALVEEMCDYVNDGWESKPALHLSAYVMWRLNWIHPFKDGNGRTSRALAYIVLCARLGYPLPGSTTVPQLIAQDKEPYYRALEAADHAAVAGQIDVSAMEELLRQLLGTQLWQVITDAGMS